MGTKNFPFPYVEFHKAGRGIYLTTIDDVYEAGGE